LNNIGLQSVKVLRDKSKENYETTEKYFRLWKSLQMDKGYRKLVESIEI